MTSPWQGYVADQCTGYVAKIAAWVPYLGNLGDAGTWFRNAPANLRSSTPVPGAVAVWAPNSGGSYSDGHVAVVTSVNPNGTFNVSEQNWSGGPGVVDQRTNISPSALGLGSGGGFILPPSGADQAATLASFPSLGQIAGGVALGPAGIAGVVGSAEAGAVGSAAGSVASAAANALLPSWAKNINWWRIGFTAAGVGVIIAGFVLFKGNAIGALAKRLPIPV